MNERSLGVTALLAVALWVAAPVAVQAHKLKAFATAEGKSINGYAYFSPGGRIRQATVTVTAPDGHVVTTMPTDEEGNFRFEATHRIDYRITVDGGDGHVATYTVPLAELPDSLPSVGAIAVGETPAPAIPAPAYQASVEAAGFADLRAFIDQSVSRQIRPLREQIDAYQEKVWMHDVLGGLGVIFGISGVAYGRGQRRRRKPPNHG